MEEGAGKRCSECESDIELRADEITLSIPESDDELLKELEQELEADDETGRPLSSSLAELVNKRFSKKLSDTKLTATLEKYRKPANCSRLNVPSVNSEIWKTVPKQSKRTAGLEVRKKRRRKD